MRIVFNFLPEPLELVSDIPPKLNVTIGTCWSLSCLANGVPSPQYEWFFGEMILDRTNRILTMKNAK